MKDFEGERSSTTPPATMRLAHLRISAQPWTGWSQNQPEGKEYTFAFREHQQFTLPGPRSFHYDFVITACRETSIDLEPVGPSPVPHNPDGTVNVVGKIERTTLQIGRSLEMSSGSLDGGVKWKITLMAITRSAATSRPQPPPVQPPPVQLPPVEKELTQVGPYQLRRLITQEEPFKTYLAYDPELDREAFLTIISTATPSQGSLNYVESFKQGGRLLSKLRHPNIAQFYQFGRDAANFFLVTEEAIQSLSQHLASKTPLDLLFASHILAQLASALDYLHGWGWVHRDVKPLNIYLDEKGQARLINLQVPFPLGAERPSDAFGTVFYMSPDALDGKSLDGSSDQYSLGVVLYQMLAGVPPFQGKPSDIMAAHLAKPVPDPRQFNSKLNPMIFPVLQKVLAKKPEQRYNSCGEFARAFQRAIKEGSPLPPPVISQASDI